jgi:hypothetical protein
VAAITQARVTLREIVSVLGRAYLGVSLILFIVGLIWFTLVLQENRAWVEVVLLVPRFDFVDPLIRRRFQMNVAAIMAGWGGCVSLLLLIGIVAPFRIRSMALMQRRLRELEREILELRTLPLRQQEEDEILAAEAHLDIRAKKVMTEKIRRDRLARDSGELEIPAGDSAVLARVPVAPAPVTRPDTRLPDRPFSRPASKLSASRLPDPEPGSRSPESGKDEP